MGNIVEIKGVNKIYGTNHVVKDLDLEVKEGEVLTLLGSSGCQIRYLISQTPVADGKCLSRTAMLIKNTSEHN